MSMDAIHIIRNYEDRNRDFSAAMKHAAGEFDVVIDNEDEDIYFDDHEYVGQISNLVSKPSLMHKDKSAKLTKDPTLHIRSNYLEKAPAIIVDGTSTKFMTKAYKRNESDGLKRPILNNYSSLKSKESLATNQATISIPELEDHKLPSRSNSGIPNSILSLDARSDMAANRAFLNINDYNDVKGMSLSPFLMSPSATPTPGRNESNSFLKSPFLQPYDYSNKNSLLGSININKYDNKFPQSLSTEEKDFIALDFLDNK